MSTRPRLIGLYSPVPGCGKDTLADHLTARHGYVNVKTVAPLKAMLAVLYTALGYDDHQLPDLLNGPNRDTTEIFPEQNHDMRYTAHYGIALRMLGPTGGGHGARRGHVMHACRHIGPHGLFAICGYSPSNDWSETRDGDEITCPKCLRRLAKRSTERQYRAPITARDLPQSLGDEWGRQRIHPDIWITCLARTIARHHQHGTPVVITDLRYPNELALARQAGATTWHITCQTALDKNHKPHISNHGLDHERFDAYIRNDGSVDELHQQADHLLHAMGPA